MIKKNIELIYGIAVWLIGILGTFIMSPGIVSEQMNTNVIKGLTIMCITAVIAILIFVLKEKTSGKNRAYYLIVSIVFLVIGVFSLLKYISFREQYVVEYPQNSKQYAVIGDNYLPYVFEDAKQFGINTIDDPVEVLTNYAIGRYSHFNKIWPQEEINKNGKLLILCYEITFIAFAAFLILIAYAINNVVRKNKVLTILIIMLGTTPLHTFGECDKYQKPNANITVEKIIIDEINTLNNTYKKNVAVQLTRTETTRSTKDCGIILNTQFIDEIKKTSDVKVERVLIRLLLAHEYAHIIQFDKVDENKMKYDEQLKKVLECQADIFAGTYLNIQLVKDVQSKFNGLFDDIDTNALDLIDVKEFFSPENKYIETAYQLFYDLSNKYDNSYHPSGRQRERAMKIGNAMGGLIMMDSLETFYKDFIRLASNYDDVKKVEEDYYNIKRMFKITLSWLDDFEYFSWSFGRAMKIIHVDPMVARYITISDSWTSFDDNPDNAFVYFGATLKNNASYDINCMVSITSETVNREDPHNSRLGHLFSAYTMGFKLSPGEQYIINDSLLWSGNDYHYPRIVGFEHIDGLYSFDYAHHEDRYREYKKNVNHYYLKKKHVIQKLPTVMYDIYSDANNNFDNIRVSPIYKKRLSSWFYCFDYNSGVKCHKTKDGILLSIEIAEETDPLKAVEKFNTAHKTISSYIEFNRGEDHFIDYNISDVVETDRFFRSVTYMPVKIPADITDHHWHLLVIKSEDDNYFVRLIYKANNISD